MTGPYLRTRPLLPLRPQPGNEEEDVGRRIGADHPGRAYAGMTLQLTDFGQCLGRCDLVPGGKREHADVHRMEPATPARGQDVIVCRGSRG